MVGGVSTKGRVITFVITLIALNFGCFPQNHLFSSTKATDHLSPAGEDDDDSVWLAKTIAQNPRKNQRQQRRIVLANKLEALLISDPSVAKSAVAMDVGIGSLLDQEDKLGQAHFLEHILFLGSEKFPQESDYKHYISHHQGSCNAFTGAENTNFHFESNHQGFEGGLERFAQFFIAPKFDPDYLKREMQVVDAEHQNNLSTDSRRILQVLKTLSKPGHPYGKFSTGSLTTLKEISREAMLAFYQQHYSANLMKLAVISKFSLDELESMVQDKFRAVPNLEKQRPIFAGDIYAGEDLPRLITIKPVKETRQLHLNFALPSAHAYWRSKPHDALSHLLDHQGKGSLLSQLKKEYLATSVRSEVTNYTFAGIFSLVIELSEEGWQNYSRVVELFFSYIAMLKKEGFKPYLYGEFKKMARFNVAFRDQEEGSALASSYASLMQIHPAELLEANHYLYHSYVPEEFQAVLAHLCPDKLNLLLIAPEVATDRVEPHFGTAYQVQSLDEKTMVRWRYPLDHDLFFLPEANPFIPKNEQIFSSLSRTIPQQLLDPQWSNFWLQVDDDFFVPLAKVELTIVTPLVSESPRKRAQALLYLYLFSQQYSEWLYMATIAGLSVHPQILNEGIQLVISGYSEKIPDLIAALGEKLTAISLEEKSFAGIKERLKKKIRNNALLQAYQLGEGELYTLLSKNSIAQVDYFNPDKDLDEISSISSEEMQAFIASLYAEIGIAGSAYGSLAAAEIDHALGRFMQPLASKLLKRSAWRTFPALYLVPGISWQRTYERPSRDNHALVRYLQLGKRSPELHAYANLGTAILHPFFYESLRTNQRLGYKVAMKSHLLHHSLGLSFVVQSPHTSPHDLHQCVLVWQQNALRKLANLEDEQFASYKQALIAKEQHPYASIAEALQGVRLYNLGLGGEAEEMAKALRALASIRKEDLYEFFAKAFAEDGGCSLSIYVHKGAINEESSFPGGEIVITDPRQFKATQPSF